MTEERKKELHAIQSENGKKNGKPNLIPWSAQPKEVQSKGGKASAEARKRRKAIKDIYEDLLSIDALALTQDDTVQNLVQTLKAQGIDTDAYTIINAVQTYKALNGSLKSAEFVRDSIGDKPDNRISIEADITTDSDRELMQSLSNRLDSLEAIETTAKPIE